MTVRGPALNRAELAGDGGIYLFVSWTYRRLDASLLVIIISFGFQAALVSSDMAASKLHPTSAFGKAPAK